jgi:hypothetical protein
MGVTGSTVHKKELRLSPKYSKQDWRVAFENTEEWDVAINIVEDRIRGRWLDAVDQLIAFEYAGFAILALDCIVLEAMWGFMKGRAVPKGQERQVYRDILTGPGFDLTPDQSDSFREFVRNGLIHDSETRARWLVKRIGPEGVIVWTNGQGIQVNRTLFHRALTGVFDSWLSSLRRGDRDLRRNMKNRMDEIIRKHYDV